MDCPALLKAASRRLPGLTHEAEGAWRGDFCFVQAADTQFGLLERYVEKRPPPIQWDREVRLAEAAVAAVNKMEPRPRFMVVCGDLVDAFPFSDDRPRQLADFFKVFAALRPDVPLVCVCGNHDVGDQPTPESVRDYTGTFGDDFFEFWVGGCRFLVLNSQLFYDASKVPDEDAAQRAWLEERLADAAARDAKHTIVFQHVPWFVEDAKGDPDQYFNLPQRERALWLDRLRDSGVSAVFAGHYHRNAGGEYRGMLQVVTSAVGVQLGDDQPGLRVVRITEKEVKHRYFAFDDVPTKFEG